VAAMSGGFAAVVRRELTRASSSWYSLVLFAGLPLLSFALLLAIFRSGVPRDLPVVVVDEDHTALSRQLTRMIDATPSMRVAFQAADVEEARTLILENRAYAIVLLPAEMERDVRRGEAPKVVAHYNAQLLLPASLIRRDLRAAVMTLSGGLELRVREGRGEPPRAALAHLEPIRLDSHTVFNPQLNYVYFLVTALLPAMLQIFVTVGTVHVVGVELKQGTAGDWLQAAGGNTLRAAAGKLLPYTAWFVVLALFMVALLFQGAGVPMRGSLQVVVVSTVLFVLAYQAVAVLIVSSLANLRFATSVAAFYCTPAFAFIGVTFPTIAMPPAGRAWGALLPLTHYVRLLVDQGLRGAPAATALPPLAALAAFILAGTVAAAWRLPLVLRDSRYWGRM
jgi:ABC-2 type transport system permease protein